MDGPPVQPTTVNLGGGFVYLRRADGHAAIIASGIAGTGAVGMMSCSDVDARDDGELRRWLQWWAFPDRARLRRVNQVHGADVVSASSYNGGFPDADGMWTRSPSDVLIVRAADCAPLWIVDPATKSMALVHAGWKGVVAGVIERAVGALVAGGGNAGELHAAVGPHIGRCCFEVGPEVASRFERDPGAVAPVSYLIVRRKRDDGRALDLGAAIVNRLANSGMRASRVQACYACTRCHPQWFHSYRRNGMGGPLMAAIGAVLA